MRILRARVPEFGPLRSLEVELAPGLNVVYGPNEAGKTTLLDFLLAHLFRWEKRTGTRLSTVLGDVDRFGDVGQAPGEVVLRIGEHTWSYPGEGRSLLHHLDLEHTGLAGLFCVRSGELALPEKEEGDFWRELKKVLSGLPEGVESLRKRAHEAAGLTPTGRDLSDQGSPGIRTEHAELRQRIETLDRLAEGLDEVAELAAEIAEAERRREELERAREARIATLHADLREAAERLDELPAPSEERIEEWAEAQETRERMDDELATAREALEGAREEAVESRAAVEEIEQELGPARRRLERAREADLEERARRVAGEPEPPAEGVRDAMYWVGLVLLSVGIGGAFFTPSAALRDPVWIGALAAALAVGGALHWRGRRHRRRAEELAASRGRILEAASECGLTASGVEAIPEAVDALEEEVHVRERELAAARERLRAAEQRLDEARSAVEAKRSAREEADRRATAAREAADMEDLQAARDAVDERRRVRGRVERLRTALQELAGMDESAWARVDMPEDAGELPAWSPDEKQALDRELERLRREHAERSRAFTRAGLERPEDVLTERERARQRVEEIELDRDAGRLAGEIFASMGDALDRRLAEALAREGPHSVAGLIERVTDRYVGVERESDDGALVVTDREGGRRALPQLSRGTRDQLFLALRVGLARSALDAAEVGEAGFFLLDDAFLTADWQRRERLVEATADLAEDGWQVVYLTCDDHLRELYEEAGARLHAL